MRPDDYGGSGFGSLGLPELIGLFVCALILFSGRNMAGLSAPRLVIDFPLLTARWVHARIRECRDAGRALFGHFRRRG
jgi:hypothetical protein